jgi:ribosomal protein L24
LEGNNKGKTGLVMAVTEDNLNATVRIDISNEEKKYPVSSMKLINPNDRDGK